MIQHHTHTHTHAHTHTHTHTHTMQCKQIWRITMKHFPPPPLESFRDKNKFEMTDDHVSNEVTEKIFKRCEGKIICCSTAMLSLISIVFHSIPSFFLFLFFFLSLSLSLSLSLFLSLFPSPSICSFFLCLHLPLPSLLLYLPHFAASLPFCLFACMPDCINSPFFPSCCLIFFPSISELLSTLPHTIILLHHTLHYSTLHCAALHHITLYASVLQAEKSYL